MTERCEPLWVLYNANLQKHLAAIAIDDETTLGRWD